MAKLKNTKNELKAQRLNLKRYQRYLPTLQLKKQQLQLEIRGVEARIRENEERERQTALDLEPWLGLWAEDIDFEPWLTIATLDTDSSNVAGVSIPVLRRVAFERHLPDLHASPPWVDEGLQVLEQLAILRLERRVFDEQRRVLQHELTVTNQRVNLFERVRIPECRDAIRRIRIFLGDVQTLEVARSKLAKHKTVARGGAA